MNCRLPGFFVHWISRATIEEWVAFPPAGDLPDPGTKPVSLALQVASLPLSHQLVPLNLSPTVNPDNFILD